VKVWANRVEGVSKKNSEKMRDRVGVIVPVPENLVGDKAIALNDLVSTMMHEAEKRL